MSAKFAVACSVLMGLGLVGCSAVGQLTVKDYKSSSGQRVVAGQAEPKAEYGCQRVTQESQDWGLGGNMNRAGATQRITQAAVDSAPAKGANYVHIITPSEASLGGFNVNAFKDAQVVYYKCASLPSAAG
jgi:hypothetical protein